MPLTRRQTVSSLAAVASMAGLAPPAPSALAKVEPVEPVASVFQHAFMPEMLHGRRPLYIGDGLTMIAASPAAFLDTTCYVGFPTSCEGGKGSPVYTGLTGQGGTSHGHSLSVPLFMIEPGMGQDSLDRLMFHILFYAAHDRPAARLFDDLAPQLARKPGLLFLPGTTDDPRNRYKLMVTMSDGSRLRLLYSPRITSGRAILTGAAEFTGLMPIAEMQPGLPDTPRRVGLGVFGPVRRAEDCLSLQPFRVDDVPSLRA